MPSDPTPSVYDQLGGAAGLRALVDRFYALMDTLETAQTIRAMHPADLTGSADKLFDFLSGWTGGPPLFVQKHGHPMLRARHLPYAIDTEAARQWMVCMIKALDEQVHDDTLRESLKHSFVKVAAHMRNTEDPTADGPGGQ